MGKLVSVISGMIYDVAVDIRPGSATYGKWHGVILDGKTNTNFWIPDGFLHGFYVSFLFQEACFFNQIFSISKLNVDEKFNQLFDLLISLITYSLVLLLPTGDYIVTLVDVTLALKI